VIFRRAARFKREFHALPLEIKKVAVAKFALFSRNWRHPSLNIHKLEGVTWHGHQAFDLYVTDRYRVLFVIDHDVIVSYSIGPHGIVSK
jgi:hypothetical protein